MGILNSWIVELISWENYENPSIPWWLWGGTPIYGNFCMYLWYDVHRKWQTYRWTVCTDILLHIIHYISHIVHMYTWHYITLHCTHTHENNVHIILYHDKVNRYTKLWSYPPFIWNTPKGTMAYITQNEIAYEWDHRKEVWNFGGKGKYTPG